jgi:hypothetical protein
MVVGMSACNAARSNEYGTIVVVGGGCYGTYYVRQLRRAAAAGAIAARSVIVVDRDPQCAIASAVDAEPTASSALPVRVEVRDWADFFGDYLEQGAVQPDAVEIDAIVPSPLMPHLMGHWLVARARARWPGRSVETAAFDQPPRVPWERAGRDGTHYVSFATWTCPVNCIEPRICPVTRGVRDWSLPERLAEHATEGRHTGRELQSAVLHCTHRAYGVGMFDTVTVLDADRRITAAGAQGPAEVIIGTVSHCHGALTRLVIGA